MKYGKMLVLLFLCFCLSGCDLLLRGSYVSIEDPQPQSSAGLKENISVDSYDELYDALANMVENGATRQTWSVAQYIEQSLQPDLDCIKEHLCSSHPIAAWAVEDIRFVRGTAAGADALSVEIIYLHDKNEIRKIATVENNEQASEIIASTLNNCDTGIVLRVLSYESVDFAQMVEDYAMQYPEFVMESPQVSVMLYPETGKDRVVELKFSYQTSRDILKNMQNQVSPVFTSAVLYVSGDAKLQEKYAQLYSFLMERYDYRVETSITPTYSLLRQGVGDARAFAVVYAAMCRQAGLSCLVVSGTRDGESWYWNIVTDGEYYFHVDLLRCSENGSYTELSDAQMSGYVWAKGFYPQCGIPDEGPDKPLEPERPLEPPKQLPSDPKTTPEPET